MIKIAHRGNYRGKNPERENTIEYIIETINAGYDVEIDAWLLQNKWYLGHDFPNEIVEDLFFEHPKIWTHAKNLDGYLTLYNNKNTHVFWHNKDDFIFTSKGIKWAYPGIITHDGIMVMPELSDVALSAIKSGDVIPLGICSDNFTYFV